MLCYEKIKKSLTKMDTVLLKSVHFTYYHSIIGRNLLRIFNRQHKNIFNV
jgi:hypothetical protein